MISYRLRGLINLHIGVTAGLAAAYFLALALAVQYTPWLNLNPDINLLLYATPTLLGMVIGGRFWTGLAQRFHAVTWGDAAAVTARQVVVVALLTFALIVGRKDPSLSRLFLAFYLATLGVGMVFLNRLLPAFLANLAFQRNHRIPAVLVGPSTSLHRLHSWLRQKEHLGIRTIGIVSDNTDDGMHAGIHYLGHIRELPSLIEERNVGQVVLLDVPSDPKQTLFVVEACQAAGCRLLVYQNVWDLLPVPMVPIIEQEHLFLTVHDEPLEDPMNRALKRIYDILVSLPVVLFLLPPICALVWLVQRKQAPGPLLFKRPRGGQRGRAFEMLKFRSMYVSTNDPKLESRQAKPGDPRIYPFGHFLRKTSLDEFPQFWNVLMGDMSIVGPRPHLPQHDAEFSTVAKTYRTRQLVKPGITGLAQVNGLRGEITDPTLLHDRVKLDIFYITHWSIWLDLTITIRTLTHVFMPPKTAL